MSFSTVSAFALYFLILLFIVLATYKKKTSDADFILGKRSLNFYLTALSAHASDMSSWLFMAFPSFIYLYGLQKLWIGVGLLIGMFLNWQILAPRLRKETEKYNALTIATYFCKRLNDKKGILLFITGALSLIFFTIYISSGILAMGEIFEDSFSLPYHIGITIGISAVVLYTFLGGYLAVAWTDLFQALFLLAVIIFVPIFAWVTLPHASESQSFFSLFSQSIIPGKESGGWGGVALLIGSMGLGYFGQTHIVTKFMGIRDYREMHKAKWVGISWQFLSLIAAVCVGLVATQVFVTPLHNPELVFVHMVKMLFHPFVGGIVLCAILAATISTIDSQVLVLASVLTEDFYKGFIRKKASPSELLTVTRITVLLSCALAYLIAFPRAESIWNLVLYAWSGLGASFGPLTLFCLYSKRVRLSHGLAGVLIGAFVVFFWNTLAPYFTDFEISPLIPAFIASFAALFILTRFSPKKDLCLSKK